MKKIKKILREIIKNVKEQINLFEKKESFVGHPF